MESYEVEEEKPENAHKKSSNPRQNDFSELSSVLIINLETSNNDMSDDDYSKSESGDDTDHKRAIIAITNTVIKPHTMMIK